VIQSRLTATLLLCATAALAQGCAPKQPARQPARQYFVDQGGIAPTCTTSAVNLKDGQETSAEMTVGGGAGRCSFSLSRDGRAFGVGLLNKRPEHGKVYIHTVGDDTRIDYTPEATYGGPDTFTVALVPGNPSLRVAVTAIRSRSAPQEPVAAPAPAKEAPKKAAPAKKGAPKS
jgi:hypothetical protein